MKEVIELYEKAKNAYDEGKFPVIIWLVALFVILFFLKGGHITGNFIEEQVAVRIAVGVWIITSFVILYSHAMNKYSTSDLSQPMETKVGFDFLNKILLSGMKKNKFQYLGVYQIDGNNKEAICDRSSKSDFQKEFANNKKDIFEVIYKNSLTSNSDVSNILKKIGVKKIEVNTLRFVHDLHPGGAFIFADPNLNETANSTLPKLCILGYTHEQKNVNNCTVVMGEIVDKIRVHYKLKPISKVNE